MTTSQAYADRVSRYVKRQAVLYQASDTTMNRCRIEMDRFTGVFYRNRDKLHVFELYYNPYSNSSIVVQAFSNTRLNVLCQTVNRYLSTLSKALESNERDRRRFRN